MKVLLVASNWTETLGHAVRSIAVAQSLAARGHTVALLGFPSYREWLPEGARFYPCEALPPPFEPNVFFGCHTYEDVVYVSGHSDEDHIVRTVERERAVIRAFEPDVIWNDEQFTIGISTVLERVPVVSLATWPLHPEFGREKERELPARGAILRRHRNAWNRARSHYGLAPIRHTGELLFAPGWTLVAPTSAMLEPELGRHEPRVHYVGAIEPQGAFGQEPDWLSSDDRLPLVYVYLSSLPVGVNTRATFDKLHECFEGRPYRVVFALGRFNSLFEHVPRPSEDGYIRFESFVPGPAVMRRARLAIYPATHSMMMSAAASGVPSVLLPDLFERAYNASCLERVGLGRIVSAEDISVAGLRELCEELIHSPPRSLSAREVQADLAKSGGAEQVARLIERAASAASEEVPCSP